MTSTQTLKKTQVRCLLARHRFIASSDPLRGFCGGPYCNTGVISVHEHEHHLADVLIDGQDC